MTTSPEMQTDRKEIALDLVEATRELMLASATTEVSDDQLRAAARQLRDLTEVLASQRRPRALPPPHLASSCATGDASTRTVSH